jgi:DNA-binding NarL/FixJ family response regulator
MTEPAFSRVVLTMSTVQTHLIHLMHKLDVHDRTDLVKYAVRTGMIAIE